MKQRKSLIFKDSAPLDKSTTLQIKTKFPQKWILIDTENGSIFQGKNEMENGQYWANISKTKIATKITKAMF